MSVGTEPGQRNRWRAPGRGFVPERQGVDGVCAPRNLERKPGMRAPRRQPVAVAAVGLLRPARLSSSCGGPFGAQRRLAFAGSPRLLDCCFQVFPPLGIGTDRAVPLPELCSEVPGGRREPANDLLELGHSFGKARGASLPDGGP